MVQTQLKRDSKQRKHIIQISATKYYSITHALQGISEFSTVILRASGKNSGVVKRSSTKHFSEIEGMENLLARKLESRNTWINGKTALNAFKSLKNFQEKAKHSDNKLTILCEYHN